MFVLLKGTRVVGRFYLGLICRLTVVCVWTKRVLDDQSVTINGASRRWAEDAPAQCIFIYKHTHTHTGAYIYIFLVALPLFGLFLFFWKDDIVAQVGRAAVRHCPKCFT